MKETHSSEIFFLFGISFFSIKFKNRCKKKKHQKSFLPYEFSPDDYIFDLQNLKATNQNGVRS